MCKDSECRPHHEKKKNYLLQKCQVCCKSHARYSWLLDVSQPPWQQKTFKGENFCKFEVLWLFAKVFSVKFGGVASFCGTSKQSAKVFSAKIFFPPIHESLLLRKFPAIQYSITSNWSFHFMILSCIFRCAKLQKTLRKSDLQKLWSAIQSISLPLQKLTN